jgi:membrane protease YdiL (CAAX protease family)
MAEPEPDGVNRRRGWLVFLAASLFEGGLAVLAWALGWLLDQAPWQGLRWDWRDSLLGLAASLPLMLLFWLCLRWQIPPLIRIRKVVDELIRPLFADCTVAELAVLSLLAGFGEELLFRGVLQEAMSGWCGPWLALAAVSLVFGLVHAITPTYAVLATLMGVFLGGLWLASGNLLVPIVAHAVYDFAALVDIVKRPPIVT